MYKRLLSPLLGSRCRYHPSCSDYARVAVARHGAGRGSLLAAWRLLRCHPFSAGGIDPVPTDFTFRHRPPAAPTPENPLHEELADSERPPRQ
ncbi:membrane protein insertion efficiency factor YidD [Tahibacter amnicola]